MPCSHWSSGSLSQPGGRLSSPSLTFAAGVDPEFGGVVFKIARVAGWVAHYLEELTEKPLRYRARAIYVTPK